MALSPFDIIKKNALGLAKEGKSFFSNLDGGTKSTPVPKKGVSPTRSTAPEKNQKPNINLRDPYGTQRMISNAVSNTRRQKSNITFKPDNRFKIPSTRSANSTPEIPTGDNYNAVSLAKDLFVPRKQQIRAPYALESEEVFAPKSIATIQNVASRLIETPPKVVIQTLANYSGGNLDIGQNYSSRVGLETDKSGNIKTTGQKYIEATKEWQKDPSLKNLPKALWGTFETVGMDGMDAIIAGDAVKILSKSILKKVPAPPKELEQAWVALGRPKTVDEAKSTANKMLVDLSNKTKGFTTGGDDIAKNIMTYKKAIQANGIPKTPGKIATKTRNVAEILNTDIRNIGNVGKQTTPYANPKGFLPGQAPVGQPQPAFGLSIRPVKDVGRAAPESVSQQATRLEIRRDLLMDSPFSQATKGKNFAIFDTEGRIKDLADLKSPTQIKALEDVLANTGYQDDPGAFVEDFGSWNESKKMLNKEIQDFNKTIQDQKPVAQSDDLIQEAKKYKSAEEFVKNNDFVFQGVGKGKQSDFLTTKIGEANAYATQRGLKSTGEIRVYRYGDLPDYIKTITPDDSTYDQIVETFGKDFVDRPLTKSDFVKVQTAIGFNKNEIAKLNQVGTINPKQSGLQVESQLTDIWKQANKAIDVPKPVTKTPFTKSEIESLDNIATQREQKSIELPDLPDTIKPRKLDKKEQKKWNEVAATTNDLKMKSGSYNLRRMMGELDGRTAKDIAEKGVGPGLKLWDDVTRGLVELEEWETSVVSTTKKILNENNIKSTSKKEMELFTNVVENNIKNAPEKYNKAAEKVRKVYDNILEKVNKSRKDRGLNPVPYRKDYVTHMKEVVDTSESIINQGSKEFGFGKPREAELNRKVREMNFAKLFERYAQAAAREIYLAKDIDKMNDILDILKYKNRLPKAASTLKDIINISYKRDVAGLDQLLGFDRGTKRRAAISGITRYRNRYALTGNPIWSTSIQPLSMALIPPQLGGGISGTQNLYKGYLEWNNPTDPTIANRVKNLPAYKLKTESAKIGSTGAGDVTESKLRLTSTKRDKFNEGISTYANWIERELAGISGASALMRAKQLGMSDADADIYASYIIESTQSAYNKEAASLIQQNTSFKGAMPFKTGIFEISSYLNSVTRGAGGIPIGKSKTEKANSLATWVMGTILGFEYVDELTGRKLSFVQSIFPLGGDIAKTTIDYVKSKITGEYQNTSQSPVAIQNEVNSLIRAISNASEHGELDQLRRELVKWGTASLGVGGGRMANTWVDWFMARWIRDGNHLTGSGDVAFTMNGEDLTKALFTGVYSTEPGKEYIDSGFKKPPQGPTRDELLEETEAKLESGEFGSEAVADEYYDEELKKIERREKKERMELPEGEYLDKLDELIESGQMTESEADKEFNKYVNENKDGDRTEDYVENRTNIGLVLDYGRAFTIDPGNAWKALTTSEKLGVVEGNLVEMERFKGIDFNKEGGSEDYKRNAMGELGIPWSEKGDYKLEHIVPVKGGGDTSANNLKVVTNSEWDDYTKWDKEAVKAVKEGKMTRKEIAKIAIKLKMDNTMTLEQALEALKD